MIWKQGCILEAFVVLLVRISQDLYFGMRCACVLTALNHAGAKGWIFFSFLATFGCLIAATWIMVVPYLNSRKCHVVVSIKARCRVCFPTYHKCV